MTRRSHAPQGDRLRYEEAVLVAARIKVYSRRRRPSAPPSHRPFNSPPPAVEWHPSFMVCTSSPRRTQCCVCGSGTMAQLEEAVQLVADRNDAFPTSVGPDLVRLRKQIRVQHRTPVMSRAEGNWNCRVYGSRGHRLQRRRVSTLVIVAILNTAGAEEKTNKSGISAMRASGQANRPPPQGHWDYHLPAQQRSTALYLPRVVSDDDYGPRPLAPERDPVFTSFGPEEPRGGRRVVRHAGVTINTKHAFKLAKAAGSKETWRKHYGEEEATPDEGPLEENPSNSASLASHKAEQPRGGW
ncbi:hypothetical protein B0T26DRAFT_674408 [Lasiosphaeria miniovina]|uniref:Uncharacterized protein n=1 Tax=Lasiosphaeria miniovina TaxID=1954250 RepID=A0AA40E0R6_9PEZI|nr:uncharacterized protein B0T26DRAFT_674408 [Lasiosphaeria miniovina]KAK0722735.1 hypothetical protein B0T26DRAFT_674408 [Lasiosphaeria miniovina]